MFRAKSWVRGMLSMAVLMIAVTACSGAAVSSNSATPTVSVTAPTLAATGTPAVSAAAALIPDGTYAGPVQQVADVIAMINDDPKLSNADKADIIDNLFEIRGQTTFAVTLDLHAGQWTQSQVVDGNSVVGSRATYAFPDDHTIVLQESCCGLTTFEVTLVPGGFRLKAPPQTKEEDKMVGAILFETGAFTRVP
jgi:hypothetical protein